LHQVGDLFEINLELRCQKWMETRSLFLDFKDEDFLTDKHDESDVPFLIPGAVNIHQLTPDGRLCLLVWSRN
jgi:hypothetical protein